MKKFFACLSLLCALVACTSTSDRSLTPQRELLTRAHGTVISMVDAEDFPQLRSYMQRAKAVLIIPGLYKAGFLVGGEYGNAVLIAQTSNGSFIPAAKSGSNFAPSVQTEQATPMPMTPVESEPLKPQSYEPNLRVLKSSYGYIAGGGKGVWGNPVFYTLSSASLGLQIGGQSQSAIFTIMTDKGLKALLDRSVKLGADIGIAVGPVGKGLEAATAVSTGADIYAFSRAVGLYGGLSLEGSVLSEKGEWNIQLYGNQTVPKQILFTSNSSLAEVQELRNVLP